MVYTSISNSEPPAATVSMASTVSAKSQPLHNFSLKDLKWTMNPTNTQRIRRHVADSSRRSPLSDSAAGLSESGSETHRHPPRRIRSPLPHTAKNGVESPEERRLVLDSPVEEKTVASNGKSKILLRFRPKEKSNDVSDTERQTQTQAQTRVLGAAEQEESTSKVWNLRPRKPISKKSTANLTIGSPSRYGGTAGQEIRPLPMSRPDSVARLRNGTDGKEEEWQVKFSIPLSKEEIEADVLFLTGSKPARRPKKRPRIVQRQLDYCFPGMSLKLVTPHSYDVSDPAAP